VLTDERQPTAQMDVSDGRIRMNYINVLCRQADGTVVGKKTTWADHDLLSVAFQAADVVAVHIEHEQGGQVNVLQFSGHDIYYIKHIGAAGLMVRCYGIPEGPGNEYAKTWFLRNNGQQDSPIEMPGNVVNQAGAGMQVQLLGYNWKEPDYDAVNALAANFDLSQCELLQ
jgi:hypothetical protein